MNSVMQVMNDVRDNVMRETKYVVRHHVSVSKFKVSNIRIESTLCFSSERDSFKVPHGTYVKRTLLKFDVVMPRLRSSFVLYIHDLRVRTLVIFYMIHAYVPSFLFFTHRGMLTSKVRVVFLLYVSIMVM